MGAGVRFHRELDQRDAFLPVTVHDSDGEISPTVTPKHKVRLDFEKGPHVVAVSDGNRDSDLSGSRPNFTSYCWHDSLLVPKRGHRK
jgi:hypothetical protein